MFKLKTILHAAVLALACTPTIASAAAVISMSRQGATNETSYQSAQANATDYTNATTGLTDIAEATVTVPASKLAGATEYYQACFYAQASKATATSGSIALVVNGSEVTIARRTVQTASGSTPVVSCHTAARPTKAAFVIKLQGVSGDTNVFTVSDVHLIASTFYINS